MRALLLGQALSMTQTVTHQVSLKRGQRKQLSPHPGGHTSRAGKWPTAVTLHVLSPRSRLPTVSEAPDPGLSCLYLLSLVCPLGPTRSCLSWRMSERGCKWWPPRSRFSPLSLWVPAFSPHTFGKGALEEEGRLGDGVTPPHNTRLCVDLAFGSESQGAGR